MFQNYLYWSVKIQNFIVTILIVLLSAVVLLQVIARKLMPVPIPWTEELAKLSLLWITYIGLAATFQQNFHIRIDLIDTFMKTDKLKKVLDLFVNVLGIIFGITMLYLSFTYLREQLAYGQLTSVLQIPMWLVIIPVVLGSVLTLIYFLLKVVEGMFGMREYK